jgi:RNA polymerase sigma factor (sigma-70 family)
MGRASLLREFLGRAGAPAGDVPSDGDLLARFSGGRDESAFHELLRRHAPLVLGVCRRVVDSDQDVEDAFQATFLVLVQKAPSVRRRASLASWLHGVAYRCAARVRAANARRRRHEGRVAPAPAAAAADPTWREVRQVIDEELARLPEKYRAPLVLCYLEGKTQCEAARALGWGTGVLRGRLDRGRERLRARLARRGLALSAGLLGAALATTTGAAAVPAALLASTQKAALLVAAGRAVADAVSGTVAALTKGALQTMLWTKVKVVTACVLLAAGVAGLGGALARPTAGADPAAQPGGGSQVKGQPPAPAKVPPQPDRAGGGPAAEKRYAFEMRDKPWAQVFEWLSEQTGLAFVSPYKPTGTFTFVPPKGKQYTIPEIFDFINDALLANTNAQKYLLLRREKTFGLVPADERIDPTLVPRVGLAELDKRGRMELVKVVLPLTALTAKEIAPDVKKMLGPFGEVAALDKANQLLVQDTAGNVREVLQMIKDAEGREAEQKRGK